MEAGVTHATASKQERKMTNPQRNMLKNQSLETFPPSHVHHCDSGHPSTPSEAERHQATPGNARRLH